MATGEIALAGTVHVETIEGAWVQTSLLNAEIESVTLTRPAPHWVEAMNAAGVPCGPVNTIDQVFADPQVVHSKMARPVTHPRLGELNLVAQPFDVSGHERTLRAAAPDLHQPADDILRGHGFTPAEITAFRETADAQG